jgi:hypothetical protein
MTRYIEHTDGKPVSGAIASNIREYARSIWRGFYDRGLAPVTWGSASRTLQDRFIQEMEKEWPVLRYCENHWKTKQLATSIYPQWYKAYHQEQAKKKQSLEAQSQQMDLKRKQGDDSDLAKQASKKSRTTIEDDDEVEYLSPEQIDTPDISISMPPAEDVGDQVVQEDISKRTSVPRARPLRDPL